MLGAVQTDDIAFVQRMAKVGSAKEPAKAAPAPHLSAARVAEKRSRTSVAEEEKLAARAELVKQLVGHGGELTSKQVSKLYKSKVGSLDGAATAPAVLCCAVLSCAVLCCAVAKSC